MYRPPRSGIGARCNPWSHSEKLLVAAALGLMAVLCVGSMRRESPTDDEIVHIPAGLSYWQRHEIRLNAEHPPLLKMLAALPLLLADAKINYDDPSWCNGGRDDCQWTFGRHFFESWNRNPQTLVFLARLPMVFLLLLLGLTVYGQARALAGASGGALSLILFATSPFFLGYGPLVITDIGLALFALWTAWALASLWIEPSLHRAMLFGAGLAAALLSKFTALLLLPAVLLTWLWFRFSPATAREAAPRTEAGAGTFTAPRRSRFAREWWALLGIFFAGLFVYVFYRLACFHSQPMPLIAARAGAMARYHRSGFALEPLQSFLAQHAYLEKPLAPFWLYLAGAGDMAASLSRTTYLLGKWHAHGVWYYFPIVAFFKLAPGMLGTLAMLSLLALCAGLRRGVSELAGVSDRPRLHLRALGVTLLVFATVAIGVPLNIGLRHFSVPIALAVVLCAEVVPLAKRVLAGGRQHRMALGLVSLFALSSGGTALAAYPYFISYYNFFRLGTPKQDIVAFSNLNWGQSLPDVAEFVRQRGLSAIYVDSRTSQLDPGAYISGATPWKCDEPEPPAPQWVAVSANFLLRQPPTCVGLLRYDHWMIADGTVVVVRVTDTAFAESQKAYWREQPGQPWGVTGFSRR